MQFLKSAPISAVEELLGYANTPAARKSSSILFPRFNSEYNRKLQDAQKIMCCHDMRGNYLNDSFNNGAAYENAFQLFQFEPLHIFCYFSHHLLSIPPVSWINCCRTHGLRVIGTLLTEWEDGEDRCRALFTTKVCSLQLASVLVRIAVDHGVDGWLINIENKLDDAGLVENMIYFLDQLSRMMHEAVPNSLVIWYDAVTTEGKLEWQNTVNSLNSPFAEACDGLFVNYTWKEDTPRRAKEYVTSLRNEDLSFRAVVSSASKKLDICDVYFGCDVFGRGTAFGGGFDSHKAVCCAMAAGASVAIFAPGWVLECCCNDDTALHTFGCIQDKLLEASMALWCPIQNARKLILGRAADVSSHRNLPVGTTFSQAVGEFVFICGEKYDHWIQQDHLRLDGRDSISRAYYDLSMQDFRFNTDILSERWNNVYECSLTSEAGFLGNSSLHVRINCKRLNPIETVDTKTAERNNTLPFREEAMSADLLEALPVMKPYVAIDLSPSPSERSEGILVSVVFAKAINAKDIRIGVRLKVSALGDSVISPSSNFLDLPPVAIGDANVNFIGENSVSILKCFNFAGESICIRSEKPKCSPSTGCSDSSCSYSAVGSLDWHRVSYTIPLFEFYECISSSSSVCSIDEVDVIPCFGESGAEVHEEASDIYFGALSITRATDTTTVLNDAAVSIRHAHLCRNRLICEVQWEKPHNYEECNVFCLRNIFHGVESPCVASDSCTVSYLERTLKSRCCEVSYAHDSKLRSFRESNAPNLSAEHFELVGKTRGSSLCLMTTINALSVNTKSFDLVLALQPISCTFQPTAPSQCCYVCATLSLEE